MPSVAECGAVHPPRLSAAANRRRSVRTVSWLSPAAAPISRYVRLRNLG